MANYSPVKDRQDIPIWNAIEANNFKQALKLVDKRLAKKPTDYLQVREGNRRTPSRQLLLPVGLRSLPT
jgi:N-terminal acetyltransferase B complex non-catalytic subunit